jgi:outer membrane protein
MGGKRMKRVGLAISIGAAFCAVPAAQAADGPWMVRGRILHMQVDNGNDPEVPGSKVELSDKTFPEVDISYFFTRNIAAELVLTYPQKHDVTVGGSKIGTIKQLPPTLMLQYHFMPDATFRPYAGIGLNYTHISSVELSPGVDVDRSSTGVAFQLGADVKIADKWFLNFDGKKIVNRDREVTVNGVKLTTLKVDPLLLSVGAGYRF